VATTHVPTGECGGCRWREAVKGEEAPGQAATQDDFFQCVALKCPPLFLQECFASLRFFLLPVSTQLKFN
jgi:hypothetical protein